MGQAGITVTFWLSIGKSLLIGLFSGFMDGKIKPLIALNII
jgi:hypothetical protein